MPTKKPKNKRSRWFRLNGKDFLKGLIVSILGGIIDGLTTGRTLKESAITSVICGGGYLVKNAFTDHNDEIKLLPIMAEYKMKLSRVYGDSQTLGEIEIFKNGEPLYECDTLELPWVDNEQQISCIPEGDYACEKRNSEKYGDHFIVTDVLDRAYILIHHGNFVYDTRGCILVGQGYAYINKDNLKDVKNSRNTMKRLNEILPDKFLLTIKEE